MDRWTLEVRCSEREERLLKLASKRRKRFVFLRRQRHELFDAAFQAELEGMYRQTGQGEAPQPPPCYAWRCCCRATSVSDAEAVRLSATDRCWRVVLGTLEPDDDAPAFSQGGLQQLRERLIRHELDRRLIERSVELAKKTKAFDWKKLPATLRLAVDSRP